MIYFTHVILLLNAKKYHKYKLQVYFGIFKIRISWYLAKNGWFYACDDTLKYKKVLFEYIFVGILPNNDLFYTFKYTFKSKKYYKYNLVYKWLILCMWLSL